MLECDTNWCLQKLCPISNRYSAQKLLPNNRQLTLRTVFPILTRFRWELSGELLLLSGDRAIGEARIVHAKGKSPVRMNVELHNDTVINVAALLKEPVGSKRNFSINLDRFSLDNDLVAREVEGEMRLTSLPSELLLSAKATAKVELECDRCLRLYDEPVRVTFAAQYEPTIDVRTGHVVGEIGDGEERFPISDNHEVDVAEPLRQELIVALPMIARCGPDCPGPIITSTKSDDEIDNRLVDLERLLEQ